MIASWSGLGLDNCLFKQSGEGPMVFLRLKAEVAPIIRCQLGHKGNRMSGSQEPLLVEDIRFDEDGVSIIEGKTVIHILWAQTISHGQMPLTPFLKSALINLREYNAQDVHVQIWRDGEGIHTPDGKIFQDIVEASEHGFKLAGKEISLEDRLELMDARDKQDKAEREAREYASKIGAAPAAPMATPGEKAKKGKKKCPYCSGPGYVMVTMEYEDGYSAPEVKRCDQCNLYKTDIGALEAAIKEKHDQVISHLTNIKIPECKDRPMFLANKAENCITHPNHCINCLANAIKDVQNAAKEKYKKDHEKADCNPPATVAAAAPTILECDRKGTYGACLEQPTVDLRRTSKCKDLLKAGKCPRKCAYCPAKADIKVGEISMCKECYTEFQDNKGIEDMVGPIQDPHHLLGYACAGCMKFLVKDDGDPDPTEAARKLLEAHDDRIHGGCRCTWVPVFPRMLDKDGKLIQEKPKKKRATPKAPKIPFETKPDDIVKNVTIAKEEMPGFKISPEAMEELKVKAKEGKLWLPDDAKQGLFPCGETHCKTEVFSCTICPLAHKLEMPITTVKDAVTHIYGDVKDIPKSTETASYWACQCKNNNIKPKSHERCGTCMIVRQAGRLALKTELNEFQAIIANDPQKKVDFTKWQDDDIMCLLEEVALCLPQPFDSITLTIAMMSYGMSPDQARESINTAWQTEGILYGENSLNLKVTLLDKENINPAEPRTAPAGLWCPDCKSTYADEAGGTAMTDELTCFADHGRCRACQKKWALSPQKEPEQ